MLNTCKAWWMNSCYDWTFCRGTPLQHSSMATFGLHWNVKAKRWATWTP